MTPEESMPSSEEEAGSEAGDSAPEAADAAPTLNRAQRRAQAKNKKGGATSPNPLLARAQNPNLPGNRGGNAGQKAHIPRTGHK